MGVSSKRERKPSGQSRMENPESLVTVGAQDSILVDLIDFNATISWRPVLVVEETGVPGENERPWASNW